MTSDDSEPLELDTNGLSVAGGTFEHISLKVQSLLEHLNDSLGPLGECWGDDNIGKKFAEGSSGYLVSRDSVIGATGALPSFETIYTTYGGEIVDGALAFQNGEDAYGEEFIKAIGATGSSG